MTPPVVTRRWKILVDGQEPEVVEVPSARDLVAEFLVEAEQNPEGANWQVVEEFVVDLGAIVGIRLLEPTRRSPRTPRTIVTGLHGDSSGRA